MHLETPFDLDEFGSETQFNLDEFGPLLVQSDWTNVGETLTRFDKGSQTRHPTPKPSTIHPPSYTPHPTPYILHPAPHTLHPTPHTLHPTP